jgi:hypothetical protein
LFLVSSLWTQYYVMVSFSIRFRFKRFATCSNVVHRVWNRSEILLRPIFSSHQPLLCCIFSNLLLLWYE